MTDQIPVTVLSGGERRWTFSKTNEEPQEVESLSTEGEGVGGWEGSDPGHLKQCTSPSLE